jgi:hypothetical protein
MLAEFRDFETTINKMIAKELVGELVYSVQ